MASSREPMRSPVRRRHHRTLVLHLRREEDDPMRALRRAVHKDCGKVSLAPALAERLHIQYRDYPHWSYQLHYDNLAALVRPNRAGATGLLFHGEAVHAGSRLAAQAEAGAESTPRRSVCRRETSDARDPQLRSSVCRVLMAPRFPPCIAQGGHSRRPMGAPDRAGHSR